MSDRAGAQNGFTLVETLVIVLIVAILASIALAAFLDQRTKAQDAEAKSAATVAAQAFAIWHQESGTYDGADADDLAAIESSLEGARGLRVDGDANSYEISVDSASRTAGGGSFSIKHGPSGTERGCDGRGRGGCPADGTW